MVEFALQADVIDDGDGATGPAPGGAEGARKPHARCMTMYCGHLDLVRLDSLNRELAAVAGAGGASTAGLGAAPAMPLKKAPESMKAEVGSP